MRKLLPTLLLIALGCHHPRCFDRCVADKDCDPECPPQRVVDCSPGQIQRHARRHEAPCPKQPELVVEAPPPCPKAPPKVEVKQPETIHVKVPPQRIIVQQEAAPQHAVMQPQAMMAQQPMMAQPQMMMAMPMAAAPSAPMGRARPGLTIDFFRMPIPIPRLIAVPDAAPAMAMQAVPMAAMVPASQAMMAQPMMAQPMMAQPMMAQPMMAQPMMAQAAPQMMAAPQAVMAQTAPTHTFATVNELATVPVNVQGQAVVSMQKQVAVPISQQAAFAVQPNAALAAPQALLTGPQAVAQPQVHGLTLEQAREFCRQVEELKQKYQSTLPPNK